jgi:predicted HNH restriction endonuclease
VNVYYMPVTLLMSIQYLEEESTEMVSPVPFDTLHQWFSNGWMVGTHTFTSPKSYLPVYALQCKGVWRIHPDVTERPTSPKPLKDHTMDFLEELHQGLKDPVSRKAITEALERMLESADEATEEKDADEDEAYPEGRERWRLHRNKERNQKAVSRKKKKVMAAEGKLLCEVCDFDFALVYGHLGKGFAECHHRVPLSQLTQEHFVRLDDLAIVCANCHRMLHRCPFYTVEELRELILDRRREE